MLIEAQQEENTTKCLSSIKRHTVISLKFTAAKQTKTKLL